MSISLTAAVRRELLQHPGVTEDTHRFGGVSYERAAAAQPARDADSAQQAAA